MGAAEAVVTGGVKSLVKKLAEVMGEVERVSKSGRNDFHRYDYATEADIVASVRGAMAKRSLMLMPSVEHTEWKEIPRKNGGADRLATLTVLFTVLDGDSGEQMSFRVLGEGQDAGDKATYKALTGATKYALLKLFLIPTGDDPEQDDRPARGQQQQRQGGGNPSPIHDPKPAPPAQAKPKDGGPVVAFGPHKGKAVADLTDEQLAECVELAHEKLAAEPEAKWAKGVRANLAALEGEVKRRFPGQVPAGTR